MKSRTHHASARRGFAGQWTCDDLEEARLQANELARPRGHRGSTPAEAWEARKRITREERRELAKLARACERERERERRSPKDQRRREALAQALVQHGLLMYTSTRTPEPHPPRRRR